MIPTLCLDGRARPVHVSLFGSALQIAAEGDFPQLAPLRGLRRISCWGRVNWAGEALIACASRAIPICYLGRGRGLGYFLPARPAGSSFERRLEEAILHPRWEERLDDWTEAELRRALLVVVSNRPGLWSQVARLLDQSGASVALRAGLRVGRGDGRSRRIWNRLAEHLHAWLVMALLPQPLGLRAFGASAFAPDLVGRFARALSPLALPALWDQTQIEARRSHRQPLDRVGSGSLDHRCALAFLHLEPTLTKHLPRALRRFEALVADCGEEVGP